MQHAHPPSDDSFSGEASRAAPFADDSNISWLSDAACGSLPLDQLGLFFVGAGRTIGPRTLALCQGCTVRSQCLAHAEQHEISNGYFGGVAPSARRAGNSKSGAHARQ